MLSDASLKFICISKNRHGQQTSQVEFEVQGEPTGF